MKKLVFTIFFSLVTAAGFNTVAAQENQIGPIIEFTKDVYDYGNLKHGADGKSIFEFKNTGVSPLIISHAQASCGCTVPQWPKEPIPPGGKERIVVMYNTKNAGPINKSVTITSNAVNEPTKVLRIKGNVAAPESRPGEN